MSRLEILKKSLLKKESLFDEKLKQHFATIKQANGQPLNDKRNGRATLNKWDRQNDSLRTLQESINKTKAAIEREKLTVKHVEKVKDILPLEIRNLLKTGDLIQWRKYPNTFFVKGVDKARIVWDSKKKVVAHKFVREITDKEQHSKFAKIFNSLSLALNKKKK